MKRQFIIILFTCYVLFLSGNSVAKDGPNNKNLLTPQNINNPKGVVLAQLDDSEEDEGFFMDDEDFDDEDEEDRKRREEEERRRKEEEERRLKEEARRKKREAMRRKVLRDRAKRQEDLNQLEGGADKTEYTISPEQVELVVEMDPKGFGFRNRDHRMTMILESDFLLRGRSDLRYDYRFYNFFSAGIFVGMDWTELSLYSRYRELQSKQVPRQLSILGGFTSKLRLTEWYMRTSLFLEPSIAGGYMWQTFAGQDTRHWRIRPGIFGGFETVFDSGFAITTRFGVEFPFDFGTANPWREIAEPLFAVGLGFAI